MEKVKLDTIEEAIEDFKAGNFVIVLQVELQKLEGEIKRCTNMLLSLRKR